MDNFIFGMLQSSRLYCTIIAAIIVCSSFTSQDGILLFMFFRCSKVAGTVYKKIEDFCQIKELWHQFIAVIFN